MDVGVPPLEGYSMLFGWNLWVLGTCAVLSLCLVERVCLEEAGGPGWLFWSVWAKLPGFLAWWTGPRPTRVHGPGSRREVKSAASAAYLAGCEMCKYIIHKAAKEHLGRI